MKEKLTAFVIKIGSIYSTVNELGRLLIPLNRRSLSALKELQTYSTEKIDQVPTHSILARFFQEGFQTAQAVPQHIRPPTFSTSNYEGAKVTPERLKEGVAGSKFNLDDLVLALQQHQPFSQQITLPLNQVKVLLYYGFLGKKPLITMDVEKTLLKMNFNYDFKRTGMLLKELAAESLIRMEERTSKKNHQYRLWTWPGDDHTPLALGEKSSPPKK